VYRRELDGEVLSFGHAGILYENSFVMYDRRTGSLWVHASGRAEHGPMKGKRLTFYPSTVTTWKQWKAAYPHTRVLPGYRRGGFMGTYHGIGRPPESPATELGLVVTLKFKGKLYAFGALAGTPVVNDRFADTDLVVYFSREDGTAVAWDRRVDGRTLTFEEATGRDDGGSRLLRDRETGSLWSWLRGEAVGGPLRGARLEAVAYNPILVDRFHAFYPEGAVYLGK
jgi:hypothetical protein